MRHEPGCTTGKHSDAAKRVCDTYNMHRLVSEDNVRKWFACALADGTSDGNVYMSKQSAIRWQHHNEDYYTFICIQPVSMTICDAEVMLQVARRAYDAGFRIGDGKEQIRRLTREDQNSAARGIAANLIPGVN